MGDYYGVRAQQLWDLAVSYANQGKPLDMTAVDKMEAQHAYAWTTASNIYPSQPVGDYKQVTQQMLNKYETFYATC